MDEKLLANLVPIILIIVMIIGIVISIKKGFTGKGSSVTTYGATAEMFTKDRKAAMETIIEQKAKKKMNEQESGESV